MERKKLCKAALPGMTVGGFLLLQAGVRRIGVGEQRKRMFKISV